VHYLVMELAAGETLAERIGRGPLAVEDAVAIALQVSRALGEAHERGIVHRDLKPGNVMVDAKQQVKVLDFGLAKALDPVPGTESRSQLDRSPTLSYQATLAGTLLGTAAYMSPEQARGEPADRRSDVWSFGVVLWEMLTGRRLFEGGSVSDTLAGILRDEIDLQELPATCPPALARVLRRCLERDPDRRLHDIADARIVLQDLADGVEEIEVPGGATEREGAAPARRGPLAIWLAATAAVAILAGLIGYQLRPGNEAGPGPRRFSIQLGPGQHLSPGNNSGIAFHPDGRSFVFTGVAAGQPVLLHRSLGDAAVRPIEGTTEAETPFFSPDGQWIGFTSGGKLRKVPAEGGRPFDLADSRGTGGAAWLLDDTLVFAPMYSDGLFRVSAAGGPAERLTTPNREDGELGHWWPVALPSGDASPRYVVFTAFRTPVDTSRVGVLDLQSGEIRWVVEGGFFGRYVDTGHLVYARGQRLFAMPFDPSRGVATGAAVPVLDDVLTVQTGGYALFGVSSEGTLAYVSGSLGNPASELVWIDREGDVRTAADERHRYLSVGLSPDGALAAVTIQEESQDLWVYSLERETLSRLTSGPDTEFDPVWSKDGDRLFYVVDSPPFQLFQIPLRTPDAGEPIWDETPEVDTKTIAVSPDGTVLAYNVSEAETGENIYTRQLDGSEPARPFRVTRARESFPAFSPDGRWIVYESDETGRPEVYVDAFPGPGERFQISGDGGKEPQWAAGSGEIFFRHGNEMRVVAARLDDGFAFDAITTAFVEPFVSGTSNDVRTWQVTPDGRRVLAIRIPETLVPRTIEIVTDWTAGLARQVGNGGG
jgi:serine/threonine-protein kinase